MVRCEIEFWMSLEKDLGKDFESPSATRSVLKTSLEDGTTVGKLFEDLANRYPSIREKVFGSAGFASAVAVAINERLTRADELCDYVIEDGDKIMVLPVYAGGQYRFC